MNTRTDKILGVSLVLAAFSFITPSHVQAQTCVTPPTCESLGYNKTTADCEGKTILKCPFDTSQVYCPGNNEESNITSYKVGDDYFMAGYNIGRVLEIKGNIIKVASTLKVSSSEITDYCDNLSPGVWIAPDSTDLAVKIFKIFKGTYKDSLAFLRINTSPGCVDTAGLNRNLKCTDSRYTFYNSCITSVQAN